MKSPLCVLVVLCLFGLLPSISAHTASTAWLTLSASNSCITGRWDIPLRDLDDALGLDSNDDGHLTWGELRARQPAVVAYALGRLRVSADNQLVRPQFLKLTVSERSDTPCAVLWFMGKADAPIRELSLDYSLFFDRDPLHRGLASLAGQGQAPGAATVLSPDRPGVRFHLQGGQTALSTFIREGIHHIWTGYDHLLFLLALLLPAVVWRDKETWQPKASFKRALKQVLQVVTAFTLAHSITLALASFDLVRLPSRLVESAIAASIAVAAIANLVGPVASSRRDRVREGRDESSGPATRPWLIPFAFGLIHGFGFAGALGELGLHRGALAIPLIGFNAGVEFGQLACVSVFLPVAFALRASRFYRQGALPLGSCAIVLLASGWLVERVFDLKFLPF